MHEGLSQKHDVGLDGLMERSIFSIIFYCFGPVLLTRSINELIVFDGSNSVLYVSSDNVLLGHWQKTKR